MPGGWGPGAWTSSGGQEPFTAGSSYSSGSGNGGGGWTPGAGRDESGYLPTHDLYSGDDNNVVLSSDNLINQDVTPQTQEELQLIQDDKVWEAATQAYLSNPGYALSFEGKKYAEQLAANETNGKPDPILPGDPRYQDAMIQAFGMPNIVMTSGRTGEPLRSEETGDYLYSGPGKYVLDKGDITTPEGYEQAKGEYWKTRTEQEQFEEQQRQQQTGYGYGPGGGGGGYAGGPGSWMDVKMFSRGRPENISQWARNIAGTPMLPVAGSGAGASMASSDELYALASGKKAFSMTPEEQGILALLNA